VDDIDYNRYALCEILRTAFSLKSLEAANGQEAIEMVEATSRKQCCQGLRLIIMDYEMPVLNGVDVYFFDLLSGNQYSQQKNAGEVFALRANCGADSLQRRWIEVQGGRDEASTNEACLCESDQRVT